MGHKTKYNLLYFILLKFSNDIKPAPVFCKKFQSFFRYTILFRINLFSDISEFTWADPNFGFEDEPSSEESLSEHEVPESEIGNPTRFLYIAMEKCDMNLEEKRNIMAKEATNWDTSKTHWLWVTKIIQDCANAVSYLHSQGN